MILTLGLDKQEEGGNVKWLIKKIKKLLKK